MLLIKGVCYDSLQRDLLVLISVVLHGFKEKSVTRSVIPTCASPYLTRIDYGHLVNIRSSWDGFNAG